MNLSDYINSRFLMEDGSEEAQIPNKEEQKLYTFEKKIELYNNIILEQDPDYIEIGSIVSLKILNITKPPK
jgi:hypothetical protein